MPKRGGSVSRYLASEIGVHLARADFDTPPKVIDPVLDQQAHAGLEWVHENGKRYVPMASRCGSAV